ncbi:MAG: hypothetical protein OXP66_15870 [Candidatus Tectomicrobia bacterium]|nr:hypothetical protein [bacterium]MDE0207490.1 hypothetical protein [Candidatus Tectomicrobia bacterium]
MLPTLTVNRSFLYEFMDAETPCGALGLVEENRRQSGFVALHLDEDIPSEVMNRGFRFGHSLFGGDTFEVIHFAFEFYGFRTWNLLINPNDPLVQAVLGRMLEDEDYFFFALSADGRATAFRSEVGQDLLFYVQANLPRLQASTTTEIQYGLACLAFARNPRPPGTLLNWVCRDKTEYLDLSTDRLELNPA